jgi:hypothetical protein
MKVFGEITHKKIFGVHVYGRAQPASFLSASWIYAPDVVDRSLSHDGSGPAPGVRDFDDSWDVRPHAQRIVRVDELVLAGWAALLGEPGAPPLEARMLYPVNVASAVVLNKLAAAPRVADLDFEWTVGWDEAAARKRGYFVARSSVADVWSDVILQGPHISVANPLYQQPAESAKNRQDTLPVDLDEVGESFIPRTNYQRAIPVAEYQAAYPKWHDRSSSTYFRLAWRRMADSATVRTLHVAILPPGPASVSTVQTLGAVDASDLAIAAGTWASICCDFLIKVAGSDVTYSVFSRLPHVRGHALEPQLILRTLRLNCLIREYASLWEDLYDPGWQRDSWVSGIGAPYPSRPALGDVTPEWAIATPLRRDADRRQALVEIDAIVAVMLDITADELATIYRTQFPVLQSYEREALYDNNGRPVPREIAKAYRKNAGDGGPPLTDDQRTGEKYTYDLPFTGVDREPDLRAAHAHFSDLAVPGSS